MNIRIVKLNLCYQSRSRARFVFPVRSEHPLCLVVAGETVNSGLDENQPELAVLILPVALQMLPDGHGLLDEVVEVLGQIGDLAIGFHDPEDLLAGHESDLSDSIGIPQDDTWNSSKTFIGCM